MRIGVVSDTHDNLANVARIVDLLNGAGVERVVHTGDVSQAKTLRALSRLRAPVFGVWGNNDRERRSLEAATLELGMTFVDPPLRLVWCGRSMVVVHDPLDLDAALLRNCHLALHGHNHRHVVERREGALVFNPGECAGHLEGHNAVGVVDLEQLAAERLFF